MTGETQTCTRCHEEKPVEMFSLDGTRRVRQCKPCRAEHWRLWHADRRQAEKERRENRTFNKLMKNWRVPDLSQHYSEHM